MLACAVALAALDRTKAADPEPALALVPVPGEQWWQVAGNPDLGEFTSDQQEPVDFAIWQVADGSWQLWSCIRHTNHPGRTRVFHRWEGAALTEPDWTPKGITFRGDGTVGETVGGMQAPHVVHIGGAFYLFHTQQYAPGRQQTSVYRSTDPTWFGIDDDSNFVTHLEVAAPEIIRHEGRWYLAALNPDLDGIRVTTLDWVAE